MAIGRTIAAARRGGQPVVAALLLAACVATPRLGAIAPAPPFVAPAFFAGSTEGTGTLRIVFHRPVRVVVHGRGTVAADGTLVLDQTVIEGTKSPTTREWRIAPAGPGRYGGSLSDAAGPVTGIVNGNRLHLTFAMRGGLHADQKLDLAADGASAHNVMVITKLGVTVATLDETIRRVS